MIQLLQAKTKDCRERLGNPWCQLLMPRRCRGYCTSAPPLGQTGGGFFHSRAVPWSLKIVLYLWMQGYSAEGCTSDLVRRPHPHSDLYRLLVRPHHLDSATAPRPPQFQLCNVKVLFKPDARVLDQGNGHMASHQKHKGTMWAAVPTATGRGRTL